MTPISSTDWPEVFTTKTLGNRADAALCADALCAWGNTYMDYPLHPAFGYVMEMISMRLGVSGTPDSFMAWSKVYLGRAKS